MNRRVPTAWGQSDQQAPSRITNQLQLKQSQELKPHQLVKSCPARSARTTDRSSREGQLHPLREKIATPKEGTDQLRRSVLIFSLHKKTCLGEASHVIVLGIRGNSHPVVHSQAGWAEQTGHTRVLNQIMEQRSPAFRGGGSPETRTDALLEHCAELAQASPSSGLPRLQYSW